MRLEAAGTPLHTRTLSVALNQAEPPRVTFAAYVLDLRKQGFAPVGGDVQGPGVIHHMRLNGVIDRAAGRIEAIEAQMPSIAFEASAATGGESCRDLIGRVDHLAGTALDGGWARALGPEIGGPRGCSHILTLAHLLGPTARWGFDEDDRLHGGTPQRRIGERIFRRDLTIDGYEIETGRILLTGQLNDLHCAPAAPLARPLERLAAQREIALRVLTAMPDLAVQAIDASQRRRDPSTLADAEWVSRADRLAGFLGLSLRPGVSGTLLRDFATPGDDAPLRDALLMLAPTLIQCFAALDFWTSRLGELAAAVDAGAFPDSCYMWRRDGALQRSRGIV